MTETEHVEKFGTALEGADWQARLLAVEKAGFEAEPGIQWWLTHEANCPASDDVYDGCRSCRLLVTITNQRQIATVSGSLKVHMRSRH